MTQYPEYYSAIDDIAAHLRLDFIGPLAEDEILESEDPQNRYALGILYPRKKQSEPETAAETGQEELFEDDPEELEEIRNTNMLKPESMGISIAACPNVSMQISFAYAVYHHSEQIVSEGEKDSRRHFYKREARAFSVSVTVPEKVCHRQITDGKYNDAAVYLHVRKVNPDRSVLLTVSVINRHDAVQTYTENSTLSLFQCTLTLRCDAGFQPVYRGSFRRSPEEEKNDMLYDAVHNFAYGHGCSTVSTEQDGIVTEIRSEFIPQYRMLQMMPRLLADSDYLYMQYWENADHAAACAKLEGLIGQYRAWYAALRKNTDLTARYPDAAERSFADIERCIRRLQSGVETLRNNGTAWKSFCYMNEAMLLQRVKTKHCPPESVSWYPFQMAYILQIIPDIADGASPFRNDVDLLWFPTGGGKTEAYLGVSAFAIFCRRLSGQDAAVSGVSVIMR